MSDAIGDLTAQCFMQPSCNWKTSFLRTLYLLTVICEFWFRLVFVLGIVWHFIYYFTVTAQTSGNLQMT